MSSVKQALLKSIEKWDTICFTNERYGGCALCQHIHCNKCPISIVRGVRNCYGGDDLWGQTSNWKGQDRGGDADMQMYMFLCMLYHEYYGDSE